MSFVTRIAQATVDLLINNKGTNAALDETKKKLRDLKTEADKSGDVFEKATKGATKLQFVMSKILFPIALFTGIVRIISLLEQATKAAEDFRTAGQEAADAFAAAAKAATTDPETSGLGSRKLQEAAAAQLNALREQREQLQTFSKSMGVFWAQIFGGPSREEVDATLAERAEQLQRNLDNVIRPIIEAEAAAREEAEQRANEAYHKRLGDEWKAEEEQRQRRQEAREKEAADLAALDEAETQRYIERIMRETEAEKKAAEERIRIAEEEAERRADALEQVEEAYRRVREEQERGLTPGDITFGSTEAATFAIAQRARLERGGR